MYCIFCQQYVEQGGIALWDQVICSRCQIELTESRPDQPGYAHFVRVLSGLWQSNYFAQSHHLEESDSS